MNKQEFSQLAMALRTYYPRENILPNPQAMELWFNQLQDMPYQVALVALDKWVATNKWAPSIADLREAMTEVSLGEQSDWGAGWKQVMSAIGNFGMYRTDEAIESMDEITKEVVKRLGFKEICISENINQDRANFRMIYEQIAERKKRDAQIPLETRQRMQQILGGFNGKAIEG